MRIIKKVALLLFALLLLMTGCGKVEEDRIVIESQEDEGYIEAMEIVKEIIDLQNYAIRIGDLDLYIKTIDPLKDEYISERKSWFRDLVNNNIENYRIKLITAERLDEGEIIATLNHSYILQKENYSLDYSIRFANIDDKWVDSDLDFSKLETKNFTVYYPTDSNRHAEIASIAAEEAYKSVVDKLGIEPEDKTIIKLYDDKELLRQFVKLSFAWQFAGWYEYPESIKSLIYESKDHYKRVIEHELVHKITLGKANNNIPYWLTEGLAVYYTDYYDNNISALDKKVGKELWNVRELQEKNLEVMTNREEISKYYASCGVITQFIAEKYGEDKLIEIVEELGRFPYIDGTGAEVDHISIERLEKVMPLVLGITIEELDEKWNTWLKE